MQVRVVFYDTTRVLAEKHVAQRNSKLMEQRGQIRESKTSLNILRQLLFPMELMELFFSALRLRRSITYPTSRVGKVEVVVAIKIEAI